MDKNTSLESKQKSDETLRRREYLLRACIATLAIGLGVEVTKERVILYLRPLSDLSDPQIKHGFALALKEYKPYGGSFPSPGEIRDFALREDMNRFASETEEILSRRGKPNEWEPMTAAEAKDLLMKIQSGKP